MLAALEGQIPRRYQAGKSRGRLQRSLYTSTLLLISFGFAGPGFSATSKAESDTAAAVGLVATTFFYATGPSQSEACPTGLAESAADLYLSSLPQEQRAQMSKAEHVRELYEAASRTKDGKEICEDPTLVPDPGLTTVEAGGAPGVNLDGTSDGRATSVTCSHQKFTGLDGATGIDNQFYRVVGCTKGYGPGGVAAAYKASALRSGEYTIAFEITGAHDLRNANDVQVGIYSGSTPTAFSANGTPLPNASISVHRNPRFRTLTRGRIVDGVLTTSPADVHLYVTQAQPSEYFLRAARLRLKLFPDGRAKGVLAGYQDVGQLFQSQFTLGKVGGLASSQNGYSCQGIYYALKRLADGYPDPKTGQCTAISSVFDIEAMPAFLIHMERDTADGKQAAVDKSSGATP